jgi:hypothetical protein
LTWSFGRTPALGGVGGLPPGFFPVRVVFSSRAVIFASNSAFSCASRSVAQASICALACRIAAKRASRRDSSSGMFKPLGSDS